MSGVVIMRALLVAHGPLLLVAPDDRIVADDLPLETDLPAVSILTISSTDRKVLKAGVRRRVTDRVQVTVLGRDAPERALLIKLVRAAAADKIGDFDEFTEVSVTTEGQGPDVTTEAGIRLRSQDFLVSYNEAA